MSWPASSRKSLTYDPGTMPTVYNKAAAEVQERMQARVLELDIEVHEEEFQYWPKQVKAIRPRR